MVPSVINALCFQLQGFLAHKKHPPPRRGGDGALGIVLLYGPGGALFLMGEVPMYHPERNHTARAIGNRSMQSSGEISSHREDAPGLRYRGTSLIRNNAPLGPYSRTMPMALWEGGCFL